jgi:hypothetical protein
MGLMIDCPHQVSLLRFAWESLDTMQEMDDRQKTKPIEEDWGRVS